MCAWGYVKPTPGDGKIDKPDKLEKAMPEKKSVTRYEFKKMLMKDRDPSRGGFGIKEHITNKKEKKILVDELLPTQTTHEKIEAEEVDKEIENLEHRKFDQWRQGEERYEQSKTKDLIGALKRVKRRLFEEK